MGDSWSAGHGRCIGDPGGRGGAPQRSDAYGSICAGPALARFRIKARWPQISPFCDSPHPPNCAALRHIKPPSRPPTNISPRSDPPYPRAQHHLYPLIPSSCLLEHILLLSTHIEPNSQACANASRKEHGGPSVGTSSATWLSPSWTATRTSASAATSTPKAAGTPDASRTSGPTSKRTSTPSRMTASSVARPPRAGSPHDRALAAAVRCGHELSVCGGPPRLPPSVPSSDCGRHRTPSSQDVMHGS